MAVFIDIPGIGTVEAKNAASEATLRELLRETQRANSRSSGGGGGGSTGGGGATGGGSLASKAAGVAQSNFAKSAMYAGQMARQAGKMIDGVTGTVGFFGKGIVGATKGLGSLATAGANLASELANVGDSLTSAARSLNAIPVIGGVLAGVLGAVAAAAESVTKSMKDASGSGASFGGSLAQFSAAAGQAGQTMEQFGAFVKNNGVAMGAFGATTEDGAKRFAKLSSSLRASSSDLYALGYGTAEINQGLANYGKLLRLQGAQGTKSNAELVAGSKKYLKEMDMLAKITGEERAAKEKEREALAVDAQLRAAMAGLGPEVESSVQTMIQSMPNKALQDFAKDLIANGTATTDANRLLMSQYPGLASQLNNLHQSTQKNVAISNSEMKAALIKGKEEAAGLKNIKTAVAANVQELGVFGDAAAGWNKVNIDAIGAAEDQQEAAKNSSDGQVEAIEKMKSSLAALTNNIMMQLANSGGLGLLMNVFEKLANFVISVVIPGIQILIPILEKIWNGMTMLLEPIIESVTKSFSGMGSTLDAVDNILNWVFDTLNGVVRGGILIFESLLRAFDTLSGPFNRLSDAIFGADEATGSFGDTLIEIGAAVGTALEILAEVIGFVIDNAVIPLIHMFQDYVLPVLDSVYKTIKDYFVPILVAAGIAFLAFNALTIAATVVKFAYIAAMVIATAGLAILAAGVAIVAGAFALLTSPIGLVILAIVATIAIFKKFGGDMQVVSDGLKYLWEGLKTFFSALKLGFFKVLDSVPGIDMATEIAETEKEILEQKAEREKLADSMSQRMAENRAKKEQEAAAEANGKQTSGLMDDLKSLFGPKGAVNADAAERHKAEKRAQSLNFRNQKIGSLSGSGGGRGAGGKEGKAEAGKPDVQVDYNAGPEALLKQFAQKEGSPLAGADAQKQAIVADADKKKQEEAAAKKNQDEAAKKAEEEKKKKEEEEKKKPESAETLLAQLNTNMIKLLAHAEQTTKNTYATYDAAKGLNKNLFKA